MLGRFNVREKLAGLGLVRREDAQARKSRLHALIGEVQGYSFIQESPYYSSSIERLLSEIEDEAKTKLSTESDVHTKALHFQSLQVVESFRSKMAEKIQAHKRLVVEYDSVLKEIEKKKERQ